jgi:O-antigen/teichoic acid export membrane protein
MVDSQTNNIRIAKNTIMLYIRMLVTTLISLYTVRIVLNVLGIEDYGIYNVVSGLIVFIGFITSSLNSTSQRFLSIEIGKKNITSFNHTFSILVLIFFILSISLIVLAELFGPWFINSYLVIPDNRIYAALFIFQLSLISFAVRLISIPFNAAIIAYEKMSIYAYLSIVDALLKLVIVYLLLISPIDKLISYGVLIVLSDIIVTAISIIYAIIKLDGCRFKYYWDTSVFKSLLNFIGWKVFGSVSAVLSIQGVSVIMNMFFGPIVNGAKAIADKILGMVYMLVGNFFLAAAPQMAKYYAENRIPELLKLFYRSSKLSFYLMLLISIPLVILMKELLELWLKGKVTDDMILFSQLALIGTLVSSLETPISVLVSSVGKIKQYQILSAFVTFSLLPITIVCFKFGMPAHTAYVINIFLLIFSMYFRVYVVGKLVNITFREYYIYILKPVLWVSLPSILITVAVSMLDMQILIRIVLVCVTSFVASCLLIYYVGSDKSEKFFIRNKILKLIKSQ